MSFWFNFFELTFGQQTQQIRKLMTDTQKRLPPSRALEAFTAAVESNSFESAARKLNRTKSTFSQQIRRLEEHTGFQLFERGRHVQPTLTPEGEKYYARVKKAVNILAPDLTHEASPIIVELDDFETALQGSNEALRKFWHLAKELDFDFSDDLNQKRRYLRSLSVSFRMVDGQWLFNHAGRQAPHTKTFGVDHMNSIIGMNAAYQQPSGRFSSFDYEVTKIYNKVAATNMPSISDVDAHVPLPDGRTSHAAYRRLVIPARDESGPIVVVMAVMHANPPLSSLEGTRIHPCPIEKVDEAGILVRHYYEAWQKSCLWDDVHLSTFHKFCFVCRPLTEHFEQMLITEIGKQHGSVLEFGESWRRNQLGKFIDDDDDIGSDYVSETARGYHNSLRTGVPQLDLIHTYGILPDDSHSGLIYYRLLTRAYLDDGSPIVVNIVNVVDRVENQVDAESRVATLLSSAR